MFFEVALPLVTLSLVDVILFPRRCVVLQQRAGFKLCHLILYRVEHGIVSDPVCTPIKLVISPILHEIRGKWTSNLPDSRRSSSSILQQNRRWKFVLFYKKNTAGVNWICFNFSHHHQLKHESTKKTTIKHLFVWIIAITGCSI